MGERQPAHTAPWLDLPPAERLKDPAFLAFLRDSRASSGLPPTISDPVTISRLVDLMQVPQAAAA
uniref:hypothetical protein n=1 Tax=Herbidospora sakaeratensis TaxID=564415 RepID=UPI000781352B|nr:hypothetical protein [Herbidospora sakaeratensis]